MTDTPLCSADQFARMGQQVRAALRDTGHHLGHPRKVLRELENVLAKAKADLL